ncbi:MAG: YHS domain-containing (seleno)protein [Pseudomonadota bacterium]
MIVFSLVAASSGAVALVGQRAVGKTANKSVTYTGIIAGTAAGGYDAVAYFSDNAAKPGDPAITLTHDGATWRFVSEENRAAFQADPIRYSPAYGGHCAWAIAKGYKAKGDPKFWNIVDNRLFLNFDKNIQNRWKKDVAGFIAAADKKWPSIIVS